jgi:hypothetical protein
VGKMISICFREHLQVVVIVLSQINISDFLASYSKKLLGIKYAEEKSFFEVLEACINEKKPFKNDSF